MIQLAGTPEHIGTLWGRMNGETIVRDMESDYLERAAAAGISRETLLERGETWVRIAAEIAPHWIVEARAVARAAGVAEDLYLAYRDGIVRDRFLHECTSYASAPPHTAGGARLFHKTRDNRARRQAGYLIEIAVPGVARFIAVCDASSTGCSMMVNEKGLAGCSDYPVDQTRRDDPDALLPEPAEPRYRGLMSGAILRCIAERASNCAEALHTIEDFVARGFYAGGKVNGNHWLFVDRDGTILEISNNSRHVASRTHTQRAYFSRLDDSAAARSLRESDDPIDFHRFQGISRDPSICFGSSISGMTVEIDPEHPGMLTCAWIALPVRAAAFPLLMGQSRTPKCLADGTAYELGRTSSPQPRHWEAMEQSMHAAKERLREEVAASMAAGNPEEAHHEMLDQWSADQARTLLHALEQPA
ncbi:MAG: hypothetical protein JXR77_19625 [Lentisphaeria bacterium]|nr:hypothetical protein [Lentisphaeria bacterium]